MPAVYTALVVVLLEPLGATAERRFATMQELRRMYDMAYERWLPHMTLIPPFLIPERLPDPSVRPASVAEPPAWLAEHLDAYARDLQRVCDGHEPMHVRLCRLNWFRLRAYANTHLRPDGATGAPLMRLQRDLYRATLPHRPRRKHAAKDRPFVPHATLGQRYTPQQFEEFERLAQAQLGLDDARDGGVLVQIRKIQLMYKHGQRKEPYTIFRELPLGGASGATCTCPTATP